MCMCWTMFIYMCCVYAFIVNPQGWLPPLQASCSLLPRAEPEYRDFPPVWLSIHQKLRHCQRGVPGCPAGGNLLPSPSTVKELIVLGRQDTVNMRVECVLGDGETHAETSDIHTDRQTHSLFYKDLRHTQAHKQIPEIKQGHKASVSPSSTLCRCCQGPQTTTSTTADLSRWTEVTAAA